MRNDFSDFESKDIEGKGSKKLGFEGTGFKITDLEGLYEKTKEGLSCRCNQVHRLEIEELVSGYGAIERVMPFFERKHISKNQMLIIADKNTYEAGYHAVNLLSNKSNECILTDCNNRIIPNENSVNKVFDSIKKDTRYLVALGSGTINDITRYVAYNEDLPYISIPTAPSMDGYTSVHSPLIINSFKKTMPGKPPEGVFVDTDILLSTPEQLISAGIGDMVGKLTARADWYLSHIVNDEYLCNWITNIVYNSTYTITKLNLNEDSRIDVINRLIEGLLISGICMLFVGNSRPASCSEHHLAHYWEMKALMGNIPMQFHGIHVGVGAVVIAHFYKKMAELDYCDITFDNKRDWTEKQEYLKNAYGSNWDVPVKIGKRRYEEVELLRGRQEYIKNNWKELLIVMASLTPNPNYLMEVLKNNGVPVTPRELGISRDLCRESLIAAKELRYRYSILQFADDIGVLERIAQEVAEEL